MERSVQHPAATEPLLIRPMFANPAMPLALLALDLVMLNAPIAMMDSSSKPLMMLRPALQAAKVENI